MINPEQGYVTPVAARFDEVPPIDEREFVEVGIAHIDERVIKGPDYKQCRYCGDPVAVRQLHAYACL